MDVREYPIDRKCLAIRLLDIQLHAPCSQCHDTDALIRWVYATWRSRSILSDRRLTRSAERIGTTRRSCRPMTQ
jgi:hypothetical protein